MMCFVKKAETCCNITYSKLLHSCDCSYFSLSFICHIGISHLMINEEEGILVFVPYVDDGHRPNEFP
jgi:hypothetical protein